LHNSFVPTSVQNEWGVLSGVDPPLSVVGATSTSHALLQTELCVCKRHFNV